MSNLTIDTDQVKKAFSIISQYLIKSDSFCERFNSQSLKEIVQRIAGEYISKDSLIAAMLDAGFDTKEVDNKDLEDFFYNVEEQSVWAMQKASN